QTPGPGQLLLGRAIADVLPARGREVREQTTDVGQWPRHAITLQRRKPPVGGTRALQPARHNKESPMAFTLPELPWAKESLAPTISAETIDYHYGKHHKAYVDNLNKFATGTKYESMSLEDVVKASQGQASEKKIFNNAAQIWNHTFFWNSLAPKAGG